MRLALSLKLLDGLMVLSDNFSWSEKVLDNEITHNFIICYDKLLFYIGSESYNQNDIHCIRFNKCFNFVPRAVR